MQQFVLHYYISLMRYKYAFSKSLIKYEFYVADEAGFNVK